MYCLQTKILHLQYSTYFFYFLPKNKTSSTKSIFFNPPNSTIIIVPVLCTKTGTVTPNTVPVLGAKTGTIPSNTVPVSGAETGTILSNTVPVWGAQTGTVNSPTADTVPVIVPVSGTKTGTVESPNTLCHKASHPPNIDKDKDKDFHSVNSSQYDSIRTENSSKNGSIHIKAYLHYCTRKD